MKNYEISYDSEILIAELKRDILEFGDFELWAISHKKLNCKIFTDYDFKMASSEVDLSAPSIKLKIGETKESMNAISFLKILEKQTEII